jgi:hypothetical protein
MQEVRSPVPRGAVPLGTGLPIVSASPGGGAGGQVVVKGGAVPLGTGRMQKVKWYL